MELPDESPSEQPNRQRPKPAYPVPPPVPNQPIAARASRNSLPHPPARPSAAQKPTEPDEGLLDRFVNWLIGEQATGFGISLILHAILLAILSVQIISNLDSGPMFTTVVEESSPETIEFEAPINTELDRPWADAAEADQDFLQPDVSEIPAEPLFNAAAAAPDGGGAAAEGEAGGSIRLFEPENAVKKGSFTAWWIPEAERFGEEVEAGQNPRPGQNYRIVIQIRVPEKLRVYRLSDLSGDVIGTDGYRQRIPEQAFIVGKDGSLIPARRRRTAPVRDGIVQLVFRVPGARADVRDTITVESKMLKEEQSLELVFEPADSLFGPP
ncbi:hypothetical protein [Maioricimonas rarisocia]|uniref:hypothetical protein n=1 Tax=Maioricimonas rarisocia TaxID=2528026 RepID=UPI00119E631B|nr:hypothetical protein [Maioricimonas rarisocia]